MKKIYLVILFYLILFIGCDKSSCDYASFEFKTEGSDKAQEGFQIILHSIWDNRIELIGRNYISGEFWNFNQGDYLELNDHYIIHYKIDTAVIDTLFHKNELTNKLDSIQTKMIDIIETWENNNPIIQSNDFLSNELTDEELNFLLNDWIT